MLMTVLYVIAITAEAMTAALAAGRRDMDWVGVCVLGFVTALGGGSLRDMLLGHYPLTWVAHPEYLVVVVCAALLTAFIAPLMKHLRVVFLLLDALGLVVFTVLGCKIAQEMGLSPVVVLVSGMLTGCAGGVIRDVLCNDIPLLLRRELYASVSLLTGVIYLLVSTFWVGPNAVVIATWVALPIGLMFRLLALRFNWQMPRFVYRDDWE